MSAQLTAEEAIQQLYTGYRQFAEDVARTSSELTSPSIRAGRAASKQGDTTISAESFQQLDGAMTDMIETSTRLVPFLGDVLQELRGNAEALIAARMTTTQSLRKQMQLGFDLDAALADVSRQRAEVGEVKRQRDAAVKALRQFEAENGLMPECNECGRPNACDEDDNDCENECVGHPCVCTCALDAARKAVPA